MADSCFKVPSLDKGLGRNEPTDLATVQLRIFEVVGKPVFGKRDTKHAITLEPADVRDPRVSAFHKSYAINVLALVQKKLQRVFLSESELRKATYTNLKAVSRIGVLVAIQIDTRSANSTSRNSTTTSRTRATKPTWARRCSATSPARSTTRTCSSSCA